MSSVCPYCAAEVPDGSRFCPSCDQFLGWEETSPVGEAVKPVQRAAQRSGGRPAPASQVKERGGATSSSRGRPALACPHTTLRVIPGESEESSVVVATTGHLVDDIRLHLEGPAAEFGVVEPEVVHLYPDSTTNVVIRFAAPRGPAVTAGVRAWTLVATSVTHEGATATIDGTTEVVPFASGSCSLHPAQTSGRGRRAEYAVQVENEGNAPWGVTVRPEPSAGLRFEQAQAALTVGPGTQEQVPVVAQSKRRWFGSPQSRTFEVHVDPTSQPAPEAATVTGTRQQLPFLPLWLLPLLLVLVGLGFAAIALFGGDAVAVPAVGGQPREQAVSQLKDAGFRVTEVVVSDAQVAAGQAVRTDPTSGTEVDSGSPVTLYVSSGPPAKEVQVPAVANLPVASARDALESVGLSAREQPQASKTVPAQSVIRSEPAAGAKVDRGYTVVLYVSTGPEAPPVTPVQQVPVPDVSGMTQQQAADGLADAGLQLGQIHTEPSDEVAEGDVIRTEPQASAEVDPDSTVDLYVSSGPEPTFVPDLVGMSQAAAEEALAEAGLQVGQVLTDPSDAPSGTVISTDPAAGVESLAEAYVDLVVSSGPQVTQNADFISQPSFAGDCRLRESGTTCVRYDDDYIWLVRDSVLGWRDDTIDGQPAQVAIGGAAEYQHLLGTDLVREVPR